MSRASRLATRTANASNHVGSAVSLRHFTYTSEDARGVPKEPQDEASFVKPTRADSNVCNQAGSLGKRKRYGTDTPASSVKTEISEVRRSPRKAPRISDATTEKRKPRRQPAKQVKTENGDTTVEPPATWEEVYNVTAEMRKRVLAPVDTMGCESLAEDHRPPRERRLQTLVALMLSSQTKDTVTFAAMRNLQENLPGGFTLESLLQVDQSHLNTLIEKVGFHNNKAKFIKNTAVILRDQFGSDIPDTIEGLVSLPGVGPKMAYLCMSAAWGRDEGIGVDVHVHRITNLWGWHKTSTPEQTRAALEAWLPKDKWHDINHLLVGFGQTICLPVGRRCGECDLSSRKMCPSAVAGSPVKKKAKREIKLDIDSGEVVRTEEAIVVQDAGSQTVHIKTEALGEVDAVVPSGPIPDIEGLGAGTARRVAQIAQ